MAAADLLEAEGRSLRKNALRFAAAAAFLTASALLALGGAALFLWAIYGWVSESPAGPEGAAAIVGAIALVLSIGAALAASQVNR